MASRSLCLLTALAACAAATPAAAYDDSQYQSQLTRAALEDAITHHARNGRELVDIEARPDGDSVRFAAVWAHVDGRVHRLVHGSSADWSDFIRRNRDRRGRYLDVEVGYFGDHKRYSALFYEDGDSYGYALRTTNTDAEFQQHLEDNRAAGRRLVDFEAYPLPSGELRYAGVWVSDPNQPMTALYYGLESADVSDLLRPMQGRVLDVERYYSPAHAGYRYALVIAQAERSGWALWRGYTRAAFLDRFRAEERAGKQLIDLDTYAIGDTVYYAGVWGEAAKSLWTIDAPLREPDRLAPAPALAARIAAAEGGFADRIGLYARNVRTGTSVGHREDELFYLASTAKLVPHFRLWQAAEDRTLDLDRDTIRYTASAWYVDDRINATGVDPTDPNGTDDHWGLGTCQCDPDACEDGDGDDDRGDRIRLRDLDIAMMRVSDNAATSMLIDDPTHGLAHLGLDHNEWLAALPGAGRGWGPVTSILDVDRDIIWQGQVMAYPRDPSTFGAPTAVLEPMFRGCAAGDDPFGMLTRHFPAGAPRYQPGDGHRRMYRQGSNNAEPRAVAALLDHVMRGTVLETLRDDALAVLRPHRAANNANALPGTVTSHVKAGSKGETWRTPSTRARAYAGVLRVGDESIVFSLNADRVTSDADYGTFRDRALHDLLGMLLPDLDSASAQRAARLVTHSGRVGDRIVFETELSNRGGVATPAFDVTFRASSNRTYGNGDPLLAVVRIPPIAAGATAPVRFDVPVPAALPRGAWHIVWRIDSGGVVDELVKDDRRGATMTTFRRL